MTEQGCGGNGVTEPCSPGVSMLLPRDMSWSRSISQGPRRPAVSRATCSVDLHVASHEAC